MTYAVPAAWNEAAWSNPEFDRLITEAEGYLDVEKRRGVMAKLEQIMLDDGPGRLIAVLLEDCSSTHSFRPSGWQ